MDKLCLYSRILLRNNKFLTFNTRIVQLAPYCSSSPDDEKKKQSQEALNKLNDLLQKMVKDEVVKTEPKLNLAKPKGTRKKVLKTDKTPKIKDDTIPESPELQMIKAVKNVATSIGGDVKQTESELLMKLLNQGGDEKPATTLSDVVKGMKIEQDDTSAAATRSEQVRQVLDAVHKKTQPRSSDRPKWRLTKSNEREITSEKIDLFGSKPLGIFSSDQSDSTEGVENQYWNKLYERELKLAITHPPSNYFQQMILWTEQGKVWKFPIDNEQGLEKEQNIYFAEHVFLDKHLEPWCPQKGPLRHFMELVCVGLSKNPYLTVEAKQEHIHWFKNYFADKKQLLKDVGALQETSQSAKQIEQ